MRALAAKVVAVLCGATLFWQVVCKMSGTLEPWDSWAYWTLWYPLSLLLAATAGSFFRHRAWCARIVVIFAQLPVMWSNNGTGPLFAVGLLLLFLLAVPAGLASLLGSRAATRFR